MDYHTRCGAKLKSSLFFKWNAKKNQKKPNRTMKMTTWHVYDASIFALGNSFSED